MQNVEMMVGAISETWAIVIGIVIIIAIFGFAISGVKSDSREEQRKEELRKENAALITGKPFYVCVFNNDAVSSLENSVIRAFIPYGFHANTLSKQLRDEFRKNDFGSCRDGQVVFIGYAAPTQNYYGQSVTRVSFSLILVSGAGNHHTISGGVVEEYGSEGNKHGERIVDDVLLDLKLPPETKPS